MAKKRAKRSIIQVAQSATTRALIKKLIKYAKPYGSKIAMGFVCMIVVAATTAASAKLMKPIINDIFLGRKEDMLLPNR